MVDRRGKTPIPPTKPQDREFIALLHRLGEQARRATREAERKAKG